MVRDRVGDVRVPGGNTRQKVVTGGEGFLENTLSGVTFFGQK